jgi:hypothetical protein
MIPNLYRKAPTSAGYRSDRNDTFRTDTKEIDTVISDTSSPARTNESWHARHMLEDLMPSFALLGGLVFDVLTSDVDDSNLEDGIWGSHSDLDVIVIKYYTKNKYTSL